VKSENFKKKCKIKDKVATGQKKSPKKSKNYAKIMRDIGRCYAKLCAIVQLCDSMQYYGNRMCLLALSMSHIEAGQVSSLGVET